MNEDLVVLMMNICTSHVLIYGESPLREIVSFAVKLLTHGGWVVNSQKDQTRIDLLLTEINKVPTRACSRS